MSAATHEHRSEAVLDASNPVPNRLRREVFYPAPTMLDLQWLAEQSGQRERVLRIAHAARQLEAMGERCDSLAELDAHAELTRAQHSDAVQAKIARLQRLLKDVSGLAADLGAELQELGTRTVCFELSRCCQRTAAEIRRQQLWNGGR